jgi:hypothetical protein
MKKKTYRAVNIHTVSFKDLSTFPKINHKADLENIVLVNQVLRRCSIL